MTINRGTYRYVILGTGRQGVAAGYDLAKNKDTVSVVFADIDLLTAENAAKRVNGLLETDNCYAAQIDVADINEVENLLNDVDGVISAVPYYFNEAITQIAIKTQTHLCDMGGNTDVVKQQLTHQNIAKQEGISVVPDCGMGPGLIINMADVVVNHFEDPMEVFIYDGGLPQVPHPPWNYKCTFHINGLTNEMDGQAHFIRDGKVTPIDTLTEPEFLTFKHFGMLEADVTSGALSTSPWDYEGKLNTYENRTLRYPGHYEWLRAYKQLGLFSEESLAINDKTVVPRELYHALLEPQISAYGLKDVCIIKVIGKGIKNGEEETLMLDLVDYYDEATGFTAMERLTGWHCAIMLHLQVIGEIPPGCYAPHQAIDGLRILQGFSQRGINHSINSSIIK